MGNKWRNAKLGLLCSKIGSGATPRGGEKVYLDKGSISLIRSQNVHNDEFKTDGLAYIAQEHADQLANVAVEPHDVLLNITGDSVARCCQVDSRVLPARVNQHVAIIRPKPDELNPQFLRYYMISPRMQSQMLTWAQAGSTRNALTKGMIEAFDVPLPPLPIQHRIADILGKLDDKIELNRRMNRTLEKMAAAIFKSWFIDFDPVHAKADGHDPGLPAEIADLFPDSFEDSELGPIPEGWKIDTIGEHIHNYDSKRVPVSGAERKNRRGSYPYYGAASIVDYVDSYLFDGIYLLVGEDGSVVQTSGMAVTQYVWDKFWVNNHAHVLQGKGEVCTEQLYLYFRFEPVAPYVTGAVQPKLSQGRMNKMPFIFPGNVICRAFGKVTNQIFARLRANASQIQTLSAIRDALLPKLLSGEIELHSANLVAEGT